MNLSKFITGSTARQTWNGLLLLAAVLVGSFLFAGLAARLVGTFDQHAESPDIWAAVVRAQERPRWAWHEETAQWVARPHPQIAARMTTSEEAAAAARIWREYDGSKAVRGYFFADFFFALLWTVTAVFWLAIAAMRWRLAPEGWQPTDGWRAGIARWPRGIWSALILLALLGGLADVVENVASLAMISGNSGSAVLQTIRYAAFAKWVGVSAGAFGLLATWLALPGLLLRLAGYWARFKESWDASRPCWFPVLSTLILFGAGVAMNQSQAILSALLDTAANPGGDTTRKYHWLWFLLFLALWSAANYRTTRMLILDRRLRCARSNDPSAPKSVRVPVLWPSIMAALPWLVIFLGLIRLPAGLRGNNTVWILMIAITLIVAITTLGIIFLRVRLVRREAHPGGWQTASLPAHLPEKSLAIFVITAAVIGMTAGRPELWIYVGPGATLAAAMMLLVMVGATLVFTGDRWRLPVIALALLAAALCSVVADAHHVRWWHNPAGLLLRGPQDANLTMEDALVGWRNQLPPPPEGSTEIPAEPLFIVATEGGGIRAAYWTAAVLGYLEDVTRAHPDLFHPFSSRTFAISGVSGGSLGAAVFVALQAALPPAPERLPSDDWMQRRAADFLGRDLLSPALGAGVLVDSAQRLIPYPLFDYRDRAFGLERGWEDAWRRSQSPARNPFGPPGFEQDFLTLWQQRDLSTPSFPQGPGPRWVPSLYLNGTSAEAGSRLIASDRVVWPHQFPGAQDALALMGFRQTTGDARTLNEQGWMPLSTAVNLSTRFPVVSPAGEMRSDGRSRPQHVVDGGYYDNSGCRTAWDLLIALNHQLLRDRTTIAGTKSATIDLPSRLYARAVVPWVIVIRFGEVANRGSGDDVREAAPGLIAARAPSEGLINAQIANFMIGVRAPLAAFINAWNMRAADATEAFKDGIYVVSRHLAGQERAEQELNPNRNRASLPPEPEAVDRSFYRSGQQPFFVELNLRDQTPGGAWSTDDPGKKSVFPLGWMLSRTACERMDQQVRNELAPDLALVLGKSDPVELIRELQKKPLGRILALLCKKHPRRLTAPAFPQSPPAAL